METPQKCAHPSCHCNAKHDSRYCGTYCEGEAKTADILCSCGHGECRDHDMISTDPAMKAEGFTPVEPPSA